MQAITTTYFGATNTKPAKIIARSASGIRVSVSYDSSLNADDMHRVAAEKLCAKLGWTGDLVQGGLNDRSEVFVFVDDTGVLVNAGKDRAMWTATIADLLHFKDLARRARVRSAEMGY